MHTETMLHCLFLHFYKRNFLSYYILIFARKNTTYTSLNLSVIICINFYYFLLYTSTAIILQLQSEKNTSLLYYSLFISPFGLAGYGTLILFSFFLCLLSVNLLQINFFIFLFLSLFWPQFKFTLFVETLFRLLKYF